MDKKTTDIVAYLSWIGLLIAFLAGDKENSKFHINQSLVLIIAEFALGIIIGVGAFIPIVNIIIGIAGSVAGIALFVFWILGLVSAVQGTEKPLPIIGGIKIIK
ncbi:MAG: hypothetical protein IJB96_08895 [Lachnospira sp.]|nr:hypothetical protein [Lachnospira sp.]